MFDPTDNVPPGASNAVKVDPDVLCNALERAERATMRAEKAEKERDEAIAGRAAAIERFDESRKECERLRTQLEAECAARHGQEIVIRRLREEVTAADVLKDAKARWRERAPKEAAFMASMRTMPGLDTEGLPAPPTKDDDDHLWRELLWLHHGRHADTSCLYGDDGEMQCAACVIDFRRMPAEAIKQRFEMLGYAAATVPPQEVIAADKLIELCAKAADESRDPSDGCSIPADAAVRCLLGKYALTTPAMAATAEVPMWDESARGAIVPNTVAVAPNSNNTMEQALRNATTALDSLWSAIGDMLCGNRPLSKEYAQNVSAEVSAATECARAALAATKGTAK